MRALVLALVVPFTALAQAVDPVPVVFLPGGAGAEGCYAQWSTRSAVAAYSAPTPASRRLRTVDAERRIDANDYTESLTAVLQVGRYRARTAVEAEGARVGGGDFVTFRIAAGDVVEILAPGPEESLYFVRDGETYSGFIPGALYGDGFDELQRPVTELWVRLVDYGDGRPASWVNTAQAGMAPREPFCE